MQTAAAPLTALTADHLLTWRHCPRRLWWHQREDAPPERLDDVVDQAGALAALKATWPMARHLPKPRSEAQWQEAVSQTRTWLDEGYLLDGEDHAILGACFESNDGARARIDVLSPGMRGLRIGRVRLATAGNDDDVDLIAWWAHICARVGLRVQGVVLMLIEQDFVYPGHGCLAGVFREVDVSMILGSRDVPGWLVGMRQTMRGPEPALPPVLPCVAPGEQADRCPHLAHCGLSHRVHERLTVDALEVLGREQADVLRALGHRTLQTVPEALLTDPRRQRALRAIRHGRAEIETSVKDLLQRLPRPWHLLRLDTIGHALPIWVGTRPYQMIPFQWTCAIVDPQTPDSATAMAHFLAKGSSDPRPEFSRTLLEMLGHQGTILAYNAGFERNRLRELARFDPTLAPQLEALQARVVDLFQILRAHAYHPEMRGSWSFKSVCHAFAPDLDIGRFNDAFATPAEAYAHSMQDRLAPADIERIRSALRDHGEREVKALGRILRVLQTS